jgi:hypothetical protein
LAKKKSVFERNKNIVTQHPKSVYHWQRPQPTRPTPPNNPHPNAPKKNKMDRTRFNCFGIDLVPKGLQLRVWWER